MKGAKPGLSNVVPMKGDAIGEPMPDAPLWLTDLARQVWDELAPKVHAKGRLLPEYVYQFASYCEAVSCFAVATNQLAEEGTFYEVKTRNGMQKKRNPAAVAQNEAQNQMRRDSALFGLSPVDAARLDNGGQGDLFNDILAQLNGESRA